MGGQKEESQKLKSNLAPEASANVPQHESTPLFSVIKQARREAFKGGFAGASAQVINVFALMWLRTTMNYQYRYGKDLKSALSFLYRDGGIPRFYRGLVPALIQSPLSRFGDTAANAGVLTLLDSDPKTANLPIGVKTAVCSAGAASFRLLLMPIDAWKTIKQVEGGDGLKALIGKVRAHGVAKLFHGSLAAVSATWVGHYPWFFTYNYLNNELPTFDYQYGKYVRSACIGFTSSVISDCASNSIRVVKTTKQTSVKPLTYGETVGLIVKQDGMVGLFGRGLKTRILTNGMQGMVFTIGWRTMADILHSKK